MNNLTLVRELARALRGLETADTPLKIRNRRRTVLGVLRRVRNYIDRTVPIPEKPKKVKTDADHAKVMAWRFFEYKRVKVGRMEFLLERAQEFVDWWCARNGKPVKRVTFQIPDRKRYALGLFSGEGIAILRQMNDKDKWRTLIHEVAHYNAGGHGRRFVLSMADVYEQFKLWKKERNQ